METLSLLVQERNARETFPFVDIHDSNTLLWKEANAWQQKCEELELKVVAQQESLERVAAAGSANTTSGETDSNDEDDKKIVELHYAESAALKNERKMREELDRLKTQVKSQDERHQTDTEDLREANKNLSQLQALCKTQEKETQDLKERNEKQERALEHLSTQVGDCEQRANLAEQQCVGLKDTIRLLQEENNNLQKENEQFATRLIEEKNRLSAEVNSLNEMLEQLRQESAMLQTVKKQEEKRKSWFEFSSTEASPATPQATSPITATATKQSEPSSGQQYVPNSVPESSESSLTINDGNKPPVAAVVPKEPNHIIQAHRQEAACVRCTSTGAEIVATGGIFDGTVKVWNAADGSILATLRGGSSNSYITCDVTNHLVAGGGNDKTCRVWDISTQRMVHQLVGHKNIITCVRFLVDGKGVVTASKDRQIKVWDISKQTYRQKSNIVLDSTANSLDVAKDSYTMVTGHTNGSLRFWDIRTGEKNAEIKSVHKAAITSVQFHPQDKSKVLTNGMDSIIKIMDVRTCKAIHEFKHHDFQTSYNWSSSVFSPDGAYVAAGSSSNGFVFVWNSKTGKLVKMHVAAHQSAGVCGIAWGRGGGRVVSTDKAGKLILWH